MRQCTCRRNWFTRLGCKPPESQPAGVLCSVVRPTGEMAPSEDTIADSFQDLLYAGGGEWMWEHVWLQAPLTTIIQAFRKGSAICVTDGPYNPSLSTRTSGAGWLIFCLRSHRTLVTGSFFEDHQQAAGGWLLPQGIARTGGFSLLRSGNQAFLPPAGPDLRQDLLR